MIGEQVQPAKEIGYGDVLSRSALTTVSRTSRPSKGQIRNRELSADRRRFFSIGAVRVGVSSSVPGVMREFVRLYKPWETDDRTDALHVDVRLGRSKWTGGRRYRISSAGDPLFSVRNRQEVLPHLEWGINWQVVKEVDRFLQIHAAVVAKGDRCVVLPASPQSGKTTLCAGLVARGWRFLSDEFALIDPMSLLAHPYPKAMCVKSGSFDVVQKLPLPMDVRTNYKKGRKGRVAYISLAQCPDRIGDQSAVRWIIFPKYAPDQSPRLTPISRGQAAFQLRQLSFNFDRFGDAGLDVIRRTSLGAQAFQLDAGRLADTCDLIDRMVDEPAATMNGCN